MLTYPITQLKLYYYYLVLKISTLRQLPHQMTNSAVEGLLTRVRHHLHVQRAHATCMTVAGECTSWKPHEARPCEGSDA